MNRKSTIALAGIVLLAGLALIENATRSVEVLPATVVDISPEVPDAGPDLWRVTFELPDQQEHSLERLTLRPILEPGDTFCIRIHKRSWAVPKFQMSADKTC